MSETLSHMLHQNFPGLTNQEIIERGKKSLLQNVGRIPISFERGEGIKLFDADGKPYYDFIAGIAVCAFGHAPGFFSEVLETQAKKLVHVSNLFYNEPMVLLAELLTKSVGLDRAFFCNSGAEANECAFKMARKHGFDRDGERRVTVISAHNSFHGRTMGAISLTGQERLHQGFHPLVPGIKFVTYGDISAMDKAVDNTVAGVILEPVLGEGGVELPPKDYLKNVADIAHSRGALLILDEIQTGLGRTGKDYAFRHFDVKPDIVTLGKALGSGYPVGATLASEEAAGALVPGSHSTTVGGAPLAMAIAYELVSRILSEDFLKEVAVRGEYFKGKLEGLKGEFPELVEEVRGLGLLLGLKLKKPADAYTVLLRERGILVNSTAGTVLRFVPPLTVTESEIDILISALRETFSLDP